MNPLGQRGWSAFAALALLSASLLLGRLGTHGFWDPQEIEIADAASAIVEGAAPRDVVDDRPALSVELVALGFGTLGASELGGRLPLALLGALAVFAIALLGARLAGEGTGLIAGAVLLTCPLVALDARALTGSIATTAGAALIALGGAGLAWLDSSPRVARAGYAAALVVGIFLADGAGGGLVGLFPPLGGLALALAMATRATGPRRKRLVVAAAIASIAAALALLYAFFGAVDCVPAQPGDRALFGHTLAAAKDGAHSGLGGVWRARVPENRTWNVLLENIAFGLFPWVAVAPFALRYAADPTASRTDRSGHDSEAVSAAGMTAASAAVRFAGSLAVSWALLGWVAATVFAIKVRPVSYPAAPAVALAIGLWLARTSSRDAARLPLAGAAAALFSLIVARDLQGFPAELPSVALGGDSLTWPKDLRLLALVPPAFGVAFALAAGLALGRPAAPGAPSSRLEKLALPLRKAAAFAGRHGVVAMVAIAIAFAATTSWIYVPALSRQLSFKPLFESFARAADDGAPLGLLNTGGGGARYYAGDSAVVLRSRQQLSEFLGRDERVFAVAPRSELCPLHQAARRSGADVFVLDDSNDALLLLSNELAEGQSNRNTLTTSLSSVAPAPGRIDKPLSVVFDKRIELIGVNMPESVPRGSTFEMTLFFKVLERPQRNWRVFVHFDGGGVRFQGDHHPLGKQCGTARWEAGDYVVDTFEVTAGNVAYARTDYRVWVGFFTGAAGNWTNMSVSRGQSDDADRVVIGTISLK